MIEILKRLPPKTLIRFLSVSKLWSSIIRGQYFMKLYLNESLTKPKSLVFVFRKPYLLASSEVNLKLAHEVSDAASSLATYYHVTIRTQQLTKISPPVHGLICYGPPSKLVVYNPCTRRSVTLPKINAGRRAINHYLGYDPINNDYKVLCIIRGMHKLSNRRGLAEEILVLTLRSSTHQDSWRTMMNIQDNYIIPHHSPVSDELCINGVLYYQAFTGTKLNESAIMSFDVRSEKLAIIKGPCTFRTFSKLTSYEGKLAVVFFEKKISGIIALWVLQDPSKEEWSKKTFVLPSATTFKK
ncbi:unnamed protein product [Eruca vesicaria subsp. sativa]|uniref:F-box domain-containing protein n=1 Tax=Eruca vesicaria subsp. sativa TaxID=29727 RepID=A0ABC8JSC3_ERUVS|nr:unnamed protein product [Eruca vesicaria subsp. sativa]